MARGHGDLVAAAKLRDADIDRLADRLYEIKADAYRKALRGVLRQHGEDRRVVLSEEIRAALREEAEANARRSVQTFNRMIERHAAKLADLPREDAARKLGAYVRERGKTRSRVVGEMAPLTARLDAVVGFYRENGWEPEFDFVGPPAVCDLCKALKAGGPWTIDKVMEVGYPHLNCRHSWKGRTRAREALRAGGLRPGTISAGRGGPAGILGSEAMLSRLGDQDVARAAIEGLAE